MVGYPMLRACSLALAFSGVLLLPACNSSSSNSTGSPNPPEQSYQVTIDRTTYGVPHILADDYASLGYGQGYAIAEDNLCVLADAFVTFRGERSLYFGPDERPELPSTFGDPLNLDADFFFRFVVDDDAVDAFRNDQPPEVRELATGFAAGYNRYLRELQSGAHAGRHADCRHADWLIPLNERDIHRRLIVLNLAGSSANWIAEIANAKPNADPGALSAGLEEPKPEEVTLALDPERFVLGRQHGIGSNTLAFGGEATATGSGISFANPHWYLTGIDRFYQQHLTIPGELDVSGASIMGVPMVLIGFTDTFSWAHTVSTARRFGFFELTLTDGDPTSYLVDGEVQEMTSMTITVPLLGGGEETRTLYRSQYGPMIDLSRYDSALGWSGTRAYAIRDVNLENHRSYANFLAWNQAGSLQEFIDAKKRLVGIPWVNTAAAGRDDERAFYSDITAVPNVPDSLVATCTPAPYGEAIASLIPGLPVLDGSRSDCAWRTDPDSAQEGAFGPGNLPSLERGDYVANMNGSHWLANPDAPLTGYARVIGAEGTQQSLRTRMGHVLARERLAGTDGLPGYHATSENVRDIVLNSRVLSAELGKDTLLAAACIGTPISVAQDAATGESFSPPLEVDVGEACSILAAWDNTANLDARGMLIWSEFWLRRGSDYFATPFDPANPVGTPSGLDTASGGLIEAFGAAVHAIQAGPYELDSAVRDFQVFSKPGTDIPVHGCYESEGCFNRHTRGSAATGSNSYMHVVDFPAGEPVRGYTLVSHSQSSDPASPHYADYTQAHSDKAWHRVPFTRNEIEAHRISSQTLEE